MPARPPITVSYVCRDVDKTYEYFTRVLGFAGIGRYAGPDGSTMYAAVRLPTKYGEANVSFGPMAMVTSGQGGDMGQFGENLRNSPETLGNGVVTWFNVPDVDKYHAFLRKTGADIDEPPTDQFWGDRTMSVRTPDGCYLTFLQPIKGFQAPPGMTERDGAGKVQATAPGTKKVKIPGLAAAGPKAKKKR